MFATEIYGGVGEAMAVGGGNGSAGDGGVGGPGSIGGAGAFVADAYLGMEWVCIILGDLWGAVVIPIVGVGDVLTVNILEFDFEAVAFDAGVIDGVKIIDGSVSNARACFDS